MAKISVRHSVAEAYGLLFGRPLTVVGLTWLPAVFYALAADFLIHRMNAAMAATIPVASGLLGEYAFFYFAALLVVTAFFGAVLAVPLTREAFGLREERVAAHFVVGAREFRLFLALLRYYLLLTSVLALFAIGAGVAITQGVHYAASHGGSAAWNGLPLETWLNSAAGALAVIILVFLTARYGFFLDAIAAAEDHVRLSRAAALSRGNFWSLAATLLVVAVPASLVLLACEMTFGGLNLAGIGLSSAPFAGILAAGLVVLHTLSSGASAGAYAELAEAVLHEPEREREAAVTVSPYVAPAAVYASAQQAAHQPLPEPELPPMPELVAAADDPQENAETSFQAEMSEAAQMAEPIEIVTPEAEPLPAPPPGEWMPPPADAHFGADPHDAQAHPQDAPALPHDTQAPLHDAQPHEAHDASVPEPLASMPEPLAAAIAATEAAHPVEAQNASAEVPEPESVAVDPPSITEDPGAPREPALHPDAEDAAHSSASHTIMVSFDGQPEQVPDPAHDAELPPPPLDPAGVLAAQSGFHTPPPG